MLKLSFVKESKCSLSEKSFKKIFSRFSRVLGKKAGEGEIILIITNDKVLQKLNKKYRKKNKPTDVLSFAYFEEVIGEIFISIDTAKKQAKERKHSLEKECQVLFAHGLLHIAGFDHNTDKEELEMEKWSGKIL